LTWNGRLGRYCRMFLDPAVVRATVDRFIALGIIRPPESGRYFTSWGNLDAMTDDDKANLAIKWSQSLSQYVSSGMIHLIQPLDYLTMILGLRVSDAKHIVAQVGKSGGWAKLKAVDPSQGSGVNGVAQNNVSKGDRQGKSSKRADKRSSADKQLEGSTS